MLVILADTWSIRPLTFDTMSPLPLSSERLLLPAPLSVVLGLSSSASSKAREKYSVMGDMAEVTRFAVCVLALVRGGVRGASSGVECGVGVGVGVDAGSKIKGKFNITRG